MYYFSEVIIRLFPYQSAYKWLQSFLIFMVQTFIDTGLPAVAFIPDSWTVFEHFPLLVEINRSWVWKCRKKDVPLISFDLQYCSSRKKVKKITLKIKDHNVTFCFNLILNHHIFMTLGKMSYLSVWLPLSGTFCHLHKSCCPYRD